MYSKVVVDAMKTMFMLGVVAGVVGVLVVFTIVKVLGG